MEKREIKFEYGFESVNGIVKKVYYLYEIPKIEQKCDVWNALPIKYVRQFTGLKDKNGKDIYENDLVKRNGHIRKVVFSDGAFCLWGIKQFEGTLDPMTVMFHGSALYNFLSDIEVIGNVFENTELSVGKI